MTTNTDPSGDCTCPFGPEDAHLPGCPMWQEPAAPPVDAQPAAGDRPTDDEAVELLVAFWHDQSSGTPLDETARAYLARLDARYRAELDRPTDRDAGRAELPDVAELRRLLASGTDDDLRALWMAGWHAHVRRSAAERDDARVELEAERAAHQVTRERLDKLAEEPEGYAKYLAMKRRMNELAEREADATDRADKAVALVVEALLWVGDATARGSLESRLAALRGDTGEGDRG